jgi:hypothetical protein
MLTTRMTPKMSVKPLAMMKYSAPSVIPLRLTVQKIETFCEAL